MIEYKSIYCGLANHQEELNNALWDGWQLMGTNYRGTMIHMVFERVRA